MTRVLVYADSVLVEDRDPERREEQWGAVVLSDSLYQKLSAWRTLTIRVVAPRREPLTATISLTGFNAPKHVFDEPACTGR